MNKLAPIVIFTYSRLDSLKKTIKYLKLNRLSKYSDLYIFSDHYRSRIDKESVLEVRKFLKHINGFKKIKIIFRKRNFGLSKNIVSGVSLIVKKYGKIIVLEDDILVSSNFLNYMNFALNKYQSNKKVWHINSWNYQLGKDNNFTNTFFTRLMNCWGWGTWSDRWKYFSKDTNAILRKFNTKDIYGFNMDNSFNYWSQILRNKKGIINTWAIFWYASIYKKKSLCLSPTESLSNNIGFDNFSESQPNELNSFYMINKDFFLKKKKFFTFPNEVEENTFFFKKIISILKSTKKNNFFVRFLLKLLRYLKFNSFSSANFISKYILLSGYNSLLINKFKVDTFKNQKKINLINSPSFKLLFDTILLYKKKYGKFPKKILDVGGGLGENILSLKNTYKIKINCTILENDTLVRIIKENKFTHCNFISIKKEIPLGEKFDIIFLSASLEYINSPYKLLKQLSEFTQKIIVIGRINKENWKNFKIQASNFKQNVPFVENLPLNKNKIVFYPCQNLSINKIYKTLSSFKLLNKKYDDNDKLNITLKKQNES